MPTYTYRAVNEDGKEVHGSLDAPDTVAAKAAIEDLHLELIDLTEAMRLKQHAAEPGAGTTFAFVGTDKSGAPHRGSVQAFSRREAFDNLHHSQGLQLTLLAPVGVPAPAHDAELAGWQAQESSIAASIPQQSTPPSKPLTYVDTPVFVNIPELDQKPEAPSTSVPSEVPRRDTKYASLFSTLRLYAGWLLAWYGLFVACGYYTNVRQLPVDIPAAEGFFFSPLILSFILAIFLYLILHSIHRALSGKFILGGALSVVGVGLFFVLRMNLV